MRYNPEPGLRGAEVVMSDCRLLGFGDHEGIDRYADENKLSKTERDGLHTFEQRGRDESRVEALEAACAQIALLPKDSLPAQGAADLVRADARMLNEVEDPVQRDHAAAAMAGIAAMQRTYKATLVEHYRPEAWEVGVHARFLVPLERPRQSPELVHFTDSSQDAMQRYTLESHADFMRSQPPGVPFLSPMRSSSSTRPARRKVKGPSATSTAKAAKWPFSRVMTLAFASPCPPSSSGSPPVPSLRAWNAFMGCAQLLPHFRRHMLTALRIGNSLADGWVSCHLLPAFCASLRWRWLCYDTMSRNRAWCVAWNIEEATKLADGVCRNSPPLRHGDRAFESDCPNKLFCQC